jgi:hypothetical protein
VLAETATAHYNVREFDEAQELFEELRGVDEWVSIVDGWSAI